MFKNSCRQLLPAPSPGPPLFPEIWELFCNVYRKCCHKGLPKRPIVYANLLEASPRLWKNVASCFGDTGLELPHILGLKLLVFKSLWLECNSFTH